MELGSWRTPEWGWRRRVAIAAGFLVLVAGILAATVAAKGPFFWYSCSIDGLQPQGQSQVSYVFGADGRACAEGAGIAWAGGVAFEKPIAGPDGGAWRSGGRLPTYTAAAPAPTTSNAAASRVGPGRSRRGGRTV